MKPCARCGVVGVLDAPKPPWRVDGEWWVAMAIRCACRIRTTTHKLDAVTFEASERAAAEARDSWNDLQASSAQ